VILAVDQQAGQAGGAAFLLCARLGAEAALISKPAEPVGAAAVRQALVA